MSISTFSRKEGRRCIRILFVLVFSCRCLPSADPVDDRLVALARLWATVEFFHPRTADATFDWDRAVIDSLPKVRSANNAAEMQAALQEMLGKLEDPVTHVRIGPVQPVPYLTWKEPTAEFLRDGVLLITAQGEASFQAFNRFTETVAKANTVVFDFRQPSDFRQGFDQSQIARSLTSKPLVAPGQRRRIYQGDRLNDTGFLIDGGKRLDSVEGARDKRAVFILGPNTQPPYAALAMQAQGNGWIVVEGDADESLTVETWNIQFPFDVQVRVRTSELLYPDGTTGFRADAVTRSGAIQKALDFARSPRPPRLAQGTTTSALTQSRRPWMNVRFEPRINAPQLYPSAGERLIGVYRIWSAIQLMDPFRGPFRAEWNATLAEFAPRILEARDAESYHLLIAEMIARARDPHATANSPILNALLYSFANPPLAVDQVESKLVVTRVLPGVTEVQPGDVVVAIDGESVQQREKKYGRYNCCDTLPSRPGLSGVDGSTVELTVAGRDGLERKVKLQRSSSNRPYYPARSSDPVQVLPANIGYIDVDRLTETEVDTVLDKVRNTNGLILDIRGSARFVAGRFAARFAKQSGTPISRNISRLVLSPAALFPSQTSSHPLGESDTRPHADVMTVEAAPVPENKLWRYEKPTIALINHWAHSSPEGLAAALRAVAGVKLVGSRTNGGFGVAMILSVPGGLRVSYTGAGGQLPDGTNGQGVGLQPDIAVQPTIEGVRQGRDEVLERALREFGVSDVVHGVGAAR